MRLALFAVAVLVAARAPQSERCNVIATNTVAFSAPDARDVVTVRATGPSCDKAVGLYTIRDAEGNPIWAWAISLKQGFGDVADAKGAQLPAFLSRWAKPTISRTGTIPDFARLAEGQTTLDRLTYQDIRARNLPMLCHFSGTAKELCIFWEPAAGAAGLLLERNYEETNR
ncbi:MAG TPA: hypothetical protein VHC73_00290 [Vitreimonas sp.]|nr:hypothetical protein [Vitreimonas sp.]